LKSRKSRTQQHCPNLLQETRWGPTQWDWDETSSLHSNFEVKTTFVAVKLLYIGSGWLATSWTWLNWKDKQERKIKKGVLVKLGWEAEFWCLSRLEDEWGCIERLWLVDGVNLETLWRGNGKVDQGFGTFGHDSCWKQRYINHSL